MPCGRLHEVIDSELPGRRGMLKVLVNPDEIRKQRFTRGARVQSQLAQGHREVPQVIDTLTPTGRLHSNSTDALRFSAIAGLGLAQLLDVQVRDDVSRGKLEIVLPTGMQEPLFVSEPDAARQLRRALGQFTAAHRCPQCAGGGVLCPIASTALKLRLLLGEGGP
jgi:DNA-binding transcriptional LysR family regulator